MDPEVVEWMRDIHSLALLPVKRSEPPRKQRKAKP
jgi:hypothetical protein